MKNLAKLKLVAFLSLILTIPMLYSSCSSDDDGGKQPKKEDPNKLSTKTILGKWKVTKLRIKNWRWENDKALLLKGEDNPSIDGIMYGLNADGKGVYHGKQKVSFTYTLDVEKKRLTISINNRKLVSVITKFDANNIELNHIEPTKKEDFIDDKGKLEYAQEFTVLKKQ